MTEGQSDVVTEVIDERRAVYGDPKELFPRVAQIWSGILGHEVKDTDVALMLIGYKVLRSAHTPNYSDNSDDIEGYLAIFREIVGDDMIHARSVSEYVEKKKQHPLLKVEASPAYLEYLPEIENKHHMVQTVRGLGFICTGCHEWSMRVEGLERMHEVHTSFRQHLVLLALERAQA